MKTFLLFSTVAEDNGGWPKREDPSMPSGPHGDEPEIAPRPAPPAIV